MSDIQAEPVFVGLTRPTMFLRVPLDFFLANVGFAMCIYLATNKLYYLLLVFPFHILAWLLSRNEPRMIGLLAQWSKTKGASLNRGYWKASSSSPLRTRKDPLETRRLPTMRPFKLRSTFARENALAKFIPYTVQLDEATIRTQNTELLRIFKLEGVAHESADDADLNSWTEALNILIRNISSPNLAIHTHVVRRIRTDYPGGVFDGGFSRDLDAKYRGTLQNAQMRVNDLYVTVIYKPTATKAAGWIASLWKAIQQTLVQGDDQTQAQIARLEVEIGKLEEICQQVKSSLTRYSPTLLKTYEQNGVTFSSPLEFLAYLINGFWQPMPRPHSSIKEVIGTDRPFFGRDALEQRSLNDSVVSGVLAIKEYPPASASTTLDGLLSAPYDLVLSQSFTSLSKDTAVSRLTRTRDRMVNSGDLAVSQVEDIDNALDALVSNAFVMGVHQLSLQVKSPTLKQLSDDLAHARTTLSELGMVVAREDVALEAAFWSQLPCNFGYRPRTAPITSKNFSGFASNHNYPTGKSERNHWGAAVALLRTASGAPYYFNFHREDLGHTTIIGPSGSGKTVTQGFLISMLEKFRPNLVFFDKDRGAEIFIRAQGGRYLDLTRGEPTGFNPFSLPQSPATELFLQKLIRALVTSHGEKFSVTDEENVAQAIKVVYELPERQRRLSKLLESPLDQTDPSGVAARLQKWCGDGQLAWVFDNPVDKLDFKASRLFGFDITDFLDDPETRTPTILYLFHRMDEVIDGRRFVCFIDEFWKALSDPAFEAFVKDGLKVWRKKNAFLVTGTQSVSDTLASPIAKTIIEQSPTQIFMPNPKADPDDYCGGFKLTHREYEIVRTLPENSRRFLVKQGQASVVAELNLRGFDAELAVLSGTAENVSLLTAIRSEVGDDPDVWLPVFHQRRKGAYS